MYWDGRAVSWEGHRDGVISKSRAGIRRLHQTGGMLIHMTSRVRIQCVVVTCVCVQVQAADSVLVVGGGSTGVEMAAEIKTEYPDKKVTIRLTLNVASS